MNILSWSCIKINSAPKTMSHHYIIFLSNLSKFEANRSTLYFYRNKHSIYIYVNKYQYILRINLLKIETRHGTSYVFCIVRFWNILKCFHLKLIWSSQCKNGNARFSKILITALSDQVWIRNQCLKFRLKSIATAVER